MNGFLLAQQFTNFGTWTVGNWAMAILVVAGIVAIVGIILRVLKIAIPEWIIMILWVLLAVVIGCAAIKFLMWMFSA